MIRVFKSKQIRQQLTDIELDALVKDFKRYKSGEGVPDLFGRDERYDHPDTFPVLRDNEVMHLHLQDPDEPWPLHCIQFAKKSDTHLVYCPAAMTPNCYLLMIILDPPAHNKAWSSAVMLPLGIMAEKFRNRY
ncbi:MULTISPECIES: type II toxin-antitoxin system YafO family toxin [Idiomarina]|uniref:Uncharacterized conserved protein, YafO-like n=1 Tax=Idiomarina loihiensis (strain ATCC BAA-735 / DSM 15497 / L2-TR) TaxID=283942 RepID=Q5QV98_IDILO|nr:MULTISPECIES: type II toxin-antitoxin system YafO family toxin [Idiomarina]AAV83356.1 Uncharacterized conserved protein, YafO-like [Idiomarina loihiensis L2TR]AGM37399.1 toxin YafO [Idiomarina loihiensis GSL 199]